MYNTPVGGVAAGFGGAAATAPWLGVQGVWLGLGAFTVVSAVMAIRRIIPRRER
jgi:Na+-driven multidrug efflux pump